MRPPEGAAPLMEEFLELFGLHRIEFDLQYVF